MVLETGICVIQCSWVVRKWGVLREARKRGKTFDEFVGGEEVVGVEERKVVVRRGGRRDWSFAGFFVAMNRRHGEGLGGEDAEKGESVRVEVKHGLRVTTSTTCSDETLVSQEPRRPDPVHAPNDPPRRNPGSEKDSRNKKDSKHESDPKNEKDSIVEKDASVEMGSQKEKDPKSEKDFKTEKDTKGENDSQSSKSDDPSQLRADTGKEENVQCFEEEKR